MSSRFPLQTLLDLSQLKLDDATRQLGELIAGEQEATRQMMLLKEYRAEYHSRFMAAAKNGLGRDQWRNYQSFLDKLDAALTQAEHMVAHTKQQTVAGQQTWIERRGDVRAYDTLAQRHQGRIQRQEQRQDQKAQDEHAARRHFSEED